MHFAVRSVVSVGLICGLGGAASPLSSQDFQARHYFCAALIPEHSLYVSSNVFVSRLGVSEVGNRWKAYLRNMTFNGHASNYQGDVCPAFDTPEAAVDSANSTLAHYRDRVGSQPVLASDFSPG